MEIFDFLNKNVKGKDKNILEIGCHIGIDSEKIFYATGAKIWGFEPDPRNLEILGKKKHFFHEILDFAVSNENGFADFYLSSGNPGEIYEDPDLNRDWSASNSLKKPINHLKIHSWCKFDFYRKVKTIRIDTFCINKNIPYIDFIWMDVQGAEDLVIEGMGIIKHKIKYVYTEYSEDLLYEGSIGKKEILYRMGKDWEIIQEYDNDILLENKNFNNIDGDCIQKQWKSGEYCTNNGID